MLLNCVFLTIILEREYRLVTYRFRFRVIHGSSNISHNTLKMCSVLVTYDTSIREMLSYRYTKRLTSEEIEAFGAKVCESKKRCSNSFSVHSKHMYSAALLFESLGGEI